MSGHHTIRFFVVALLGCAADTDSPEGGTPTEPGDEIRPQPVPAPGFATVIDAESVRFSRQAANLQISGNVSAAGQPGTATESLALRLVDLQSGKGFDATTRNDAFSFLTDSADKSRWFIGFALINEGAVVIDNSSGTGKEVSGCLGLAPTEPAMRVVHLPQSEVGRLRILRLRLFNLCAKPVIAISGMRVLEDKAVGVETKQVTVTDHLDVSVTVRPVHVGFYRSIIALDTDTGVLPIIVDGDGS